MSNEAISGVHSSALGMVSTRHGQHSAWHLAGLGGNGGVYMSDSHYRRHGFPLKNEISANVSKNNPQPYIDPLFYSAVSTECKIVLSIIYSLRKKNNSAALLRGKNFWRPLSGKQKFQTASP